jgi:hypothetical protein
MKANFSGPLYALGVIITVDLSFVISTNSFLNYKEIMFWTVVLYLHGIFLFASSVPLAGYNHGASKFAFITLILV